MKIKDFVKNNLNLIKRALDCKNTKELIAFAEKNGINIEPQDVIEIFGILTTIKKNAKNIENLDLEKLKNVASGASEKFYYDEQTNTIKK